MKNKKWVKKSFIALGILLVIFLLVNFGLNIWLQTQLPNYIKNNTDYKVSYKSLDVDLGSGNILSTGITVNNKNPENTNVIGLQGTIDTLKVSRFGIFQALFHKRISSSDLLLAKPNLNIILARPVDKKTGKKRSPFLLENISINDGNISIFRHTKQKFLSVHDLDLFVQNLQMTEESVENKLPVVFDQYDIKGRDFFFRPDQMYALTIKNISTTNGQMLVEDFKLIPLLNFTQFKRFYPQRAKMYKFDIQRMEFKDVLLKKNIISLGNASFQNPNLSVYTTNVILSQKPKPLGFEVNLDNVKLNNASVKIIKPTGDDLLTAQSLYMNVDQLKFSKETSEEIIPVQYEKFLFSGKEIRYTNDQDIHIESFSLDQKRGELNAITVLSAPGAKTSVDLKIAQVAFHINKWKSIDKKLNLDVQDLVIDRVNGNIKSHNASAPKKEINIKGIQFPVLIRKVALKHSNIAYEKDGKPLVLKDLNASLDEVELSSKTNNKGIAFKVKDYSLTTKNVAYKTKFYTMSLDLFTLGKHKIQVNNFAMKPLVSRAQFIRMIPTERDLYDLKAKQITAEGNWDLFSQDKMINASNVTILSADANIFRSKIPKDDPREKPLYSKLLRSIKFPMYIQHLELKNSLLEYEEDTPESNGPGKLTFGDFNMNVRNLNSAKYKGKPSQVQIGIDCSFMNTSPLSVNWNFDTANKSDAFTIAGRATSLPATRINPFIKPYLHISATGTIQEMLFNFKGNYKGLNGTFNLKHKDLKITVLSKKNQEKKGVLTAVANLFINSDSGKFPEAVMVEDVERDPTKSFFNLFWKGIQEGLKITLIGRKADKTEKVIQNTVSAVKDVKDLKKTIQEVKENRKEERAKRKK
ncbi:hypothetical protein [Chryseobacterium sp.]|uniref:hypothetical protein n=1 Tax=Chryseobacterium sp. TaxID=1871047 RepID=UPI0025BE93FD|nr:hypothetical protein [Chryseobacterium sp.]